MNEIYAVYCDGTFEEELVGRAYSDIWTGMGRKQFIPVSLQDAQRIAGSNEKMRRELTVLVQPS